MKLVYRRR